jgi:hypothetical protein
LNAQRGAESSADRSPSAEKTISPNPETERPAIAKSSIAGSVDATLDALDVVEVALAKAIEGATEAKEWATVARLAGELEARRLARLGTVDLAGERQRRGRQ